MCFRRRPKRWKRHTQSPRICGSGSCGFWWSAWRRENQSHNRTFKDDWVFAITVRNGKLTKIREYIDTQALARASWTRRAGVALAVSGHRGERWISRVAHSRTPRARRMPNRNGDPMSVSQSNVSELIRFAQVEAGSTVIDVYPGDGDWTRLFSDVVGPEGRVYSLVPAEVAFHERSVGRMRTLAEGDRAERTSKPSRRTSLRCRRLRGQRMSYGCTCSTTISTPR